MIIRCQWIQSFTIIIRCPSANHVHNNSLSILYLRTHTRILHLLLLLSLIALMRSAVCVLTFEEFSYFCPCSKQIVAFTILLADVRVTSIYHNLTHDLLAAIECVNALVREWVSEWSPGLCKILKVTLDKKHTIVSPGRIYTIPLET